MRLSYWILVFVVIFNSCLIADVKLPAIISNNMVLQQQTDVSLWGWADPAEKIEIETGWQEKKECIANSDGRWNCKVKTPKAGGPYTLTFEAKNTIKVTNIIVGELWLCSGQSNMEMPMVGFKKQPVYGSEGDIANSANKFIRFFNMNNKISNSPQENVEGQWVECSPETAKKFSAAGYYFGREINKNTGCPVGLICSSWGGTLAQAWTRLDYIKNDDDLKVTLDKYNNLIAGWKNKCADAAKKKKPKPNKPYRARPFDEPGVLYNAMIAPLTNMTIKGVIWYQGESNRGAAYLYREIFPTLIKNWRCDFKNFDMPFYFVQLASFGGRHSPGNEVEIYKGEPRDDKWAELREAQLLTNSLNNTGIVVTIDIGSKNSYHPGYKKEVGQRLSLWALANEYGKDLVYSGPLYSGYKVEGDKIRIFFDHTEPGLCFKNGGAAGFAIAARDRKFIWADAKIEGNTVVVYCEKIKEPVAVRYAWDCYPDISLYNKADLPASPFRTDDWHGVTYGSIL